MNKKFEESRQRMKNNKFYTESRELHQEEVQMVKSLQIVKGERAEKKIYKAIKKYFDKTNEEVVVLYSFNFMGKLASKNYDPCEKDFILINLTKRYIMPLEIKTTFHMDALKKFSQE